MCDGEVEMWVKDKKAITIYCWGGNRGLRAMVSFYLVLFCSPFSKIKAEMGDEYWGLAGDDILRGEMISYGVEGWTRYDISTRAQPPIVIQTLSFSRICLSVSKKHQLRCFARKGNCVSDKLVTAENPPCCQKRLGASGLGMGKIRDKREIQNTGLSETLKRAELE